jgi:hypothetical protein
VKTYQLLLWLLSWEYQCASLLAKNMLSRTNQAKSRSRFVKLIKVYGEGMICWKVCETFGNNVVLELPVYHIPNDGVHRLSPWVSLVMVGGQVIHTTTDLQIHLNNDISLVARYCPHSNPSLLSCCKKAISCFWINAFDVSDNTTLFYSQSKCVEAGQQ